MQNVGTVPNVQNPLYFLMISGIIKELHENENEYIT